MGLISRRRDAGAEPSERESLEAELALLREENARLKVDAAKPPGPGRAIERLRGVVEIASAQPAANEADRADEAWQALSEATMLREVLADVCVEVQNAIAAVHTRLQAVASPETSDGASVAPPPALGPACDTCGAPLRSDRVGHLHAAPVHLRPAQAVGDGGVISSWEVGE
jgi:hypothetical protein